VLEEFADVDGRHGSVLVEPLAVEVADPRREAQAEQVVGAEDHITV